jgi:hypothetical protein
LDQLPAVLADPTQVHDGRVWASVLDVLPGAVLPDGAEVVAAWGDLTWTALVEWDRSEAGVLWLHPGRSLSVPVVQGTYDIDFVDRVVSGVEAVAGPWTAAQRAQVRGVVDTAMAPLVDDLSSVVEHHLANARVTRSIAVEALRYLEGTGPTKAIRRFLNSVPGSELIRVARYYRQSRSP